MLYILCSRAVYILYRSNVCSRLAYVHAFLSSKAGALEPGFLMAEDASLESEIIGTGDLIRTYPDEKTVLGEGSFGVVFATRGVDNSRVAVKIIPVSYTHLTLPTILLV